MVFLGLLIAVLGQSDLARISGAVYGVEGGPVAGARVFLEPGLGASLEETRSGPDGSFAFGAVLPTDRAGVFAVAPGYAIDGTSVRVPIGDHIDDVTIRLGRPATVSGKVVDATGRGIPNARIDGWAIPAAKIGIPLAKLAPLGVRIPTTDGEGAFTLEDVPEGSVIDLKVVHAEFAQAGISDVRAGAQDVRVVMDQGTLVRGHVRLRGSERPVTSAPVLISRAQPPFDSVIARTGIDGGFNVRLLPGVYLCEVRGGAYRSPSPLRIDVTGQVYTQNLALYAAGTGFLGGTVKNAETGAPVEGARVRVETLGVPAAVSETGPGGEFRFEVAEGEATLRLLSAPGHYDPQGRALTFPIRTGSNVEHTFWVVKTPRATVSVQDAEGNPVGGAAVRLVRPAQFGWHFSDGAGRVALEVGTLPPDGVVVGIAERAGSGTGALFAVDGRSAEVTPVELGPFGSVTGRVVDDNKKPVIGAVVTCIFADASMPERPVMWQTVSRNDGSFVWNAVPTQVPLICTAQANSESGGVSARMPVSFIVNAREQRVIGDLVVGGAVSATSLAGTTLDIAPYPRQCGPAISSGRKVVAFFSAEEAPYALETWGALQRIAGARVVAVVDGNADCAATALTVLRGAAPGVARTYVVDGGGRVELETFGLPPLALVNTD